MGWTEDAELHKRYVEWREEVELELGSSLSGKSNSVKSNYVLRWAGKPARDYLKSLPESEFKCEGASAESILQALEQKTKTKSNEIAAFTKLCSLKQEDMPLSEFIHKARRLAELCNYPNDKDRLIRDTIVSGIQSLRAYQKCIDAKYLSLQQDSINICQAEDAVRMQVLECRPESVKLMQSAQTAVPVHRLQNGSRQPSNSNRNKNKTARNCYYCGAQNWTREHSKICKPKNHTCGRCSKKEHLESLCRSARTPLHMIEAQDYTSLQLMQSQEILQDYNQSLETAQYFTPYFMSKGELPQTTCNSLKTVQVSRLGANEQSEHIQPAWIAQSQNSKKHQLDVEIETGAGCNVMPLYKVQELFGQE